MIKLNKRIFVILLIILNLNVLIGKQNDNNNDKNQDYSTTLCGEDLYKKFQFIYHTRNGKRKKIIISDYDNLNEEDRKLVDKFKKAIYKAMELLENCKKFDWKEREDMCKHVKVYRYNVVFEDGLVNKTDDGCGIIKPVPFWGDFIYIENNIDPNGNGLCCPTAYELAHELIHEYLYTTNECKVYYFEEHCFKCEKDEYYEKKYKKYKCYENEKYMEWKKQHDNMDDNYSYSNGVFVKNEIKTLDIDKNNLSSDFVYIKIPELMILNADDMKIKENIWNRYVGDNLISLDDISEINKIESSNVLIIPSGELMEDENDLSLKETLKQYVSNGGTIVVFAQQYGRHVENIIPIPDGERLKVYGWREDQSCYWGSVYGSIKHPVLSSLRSDWASVAVDGYIDEYPQNSVILLRRISNRKPALLYYKYGKGTVILTTLYTDWGYAHSQASSSELNIVRDLLTFSKDTDNDIPMYNISENENPVVKLNLKLRNDTEVVNCELGIWNYRELK